MRKWLSVEDQQGNSIYNTSDIQLAIADFMNKDIMRAAHALDHMRYKLMHRVETEMRWDREFKEQQRKKTREELGRKGYLRMAPEVGAYEEYLVGDMLNEEQLKWWSFQHERYCGFGTFKELNN